MRSPFVLLLLFVSLFIVWCPTAFAADIPSNNPDWLWQNPRPRGTSVEGIALVGQSEVWTVGSGAERCLRSTDNGATWSSVSAVSEFGATAITFPDADHGYAVGTDTIDPTTLAGVVYRSGDGGETWDSEPLVFGDSASFTDLAFPTVDDGWIVGSEGLIFATSDGGDSWQQQGPGMEDDLNGVCFIDPQRGWAVGSQGAIWVTADAGGTWTPQEGPAGVDVSTVDLDAVAVADDGLHGWAVGSGGAIWRTTDGVAWSEQTSPTDEEYNAIVCADGSRAWAATTSGTIVRTADGGDTWTVAKRGPQKLYCLALSDDGSTLWAGGSSGELLLSTDGGSSWTTRTRGFNDPCLADIDAVDHSTAWTVGERGLILATIDGGATWTRQRTPVGNVLNGVSFGSNGTGFAVGNAGTLLRTSNGGATWRRSGRPVRSRLTCVSAVDEEYVWVAGDNGRIYRSTDGGRRWRRQRSHTRADISSITFVDRRYGWAVAGENILLRTTDGGRRWKLTRPQAPIKDPDPQAFYSVCFVDRKYGWIAAGGAGLPGYSIMRTTNGGKTWRWTGLQSGSFMLDVSFADRRHGCAVGEQSVMYTTDDGGRTWDFQGVTDGIGGLDAIDMVGPQTGWTVGPFTTILKTGGEVDPEPRAMAWATQVVRRGRTARLPVKLLRSPGGTARVVVKIRKVGRHGSIKTLTRRGLRVKRVRRLSFRCWLPKGRYRYYVYALAPDGTWQKSPSSKPLIVR